MSGRDVTGRWEGIFNYPCAMPPNGFAATLAEQGGAITGETREQDEGGATLHAGLAGERVGASVSFVKRYADAARADHPVTYAGTLAPEGDEIVGEWTIPGVWSGTFIMVRQPGRGVAVTEEVGAEAH